MDSLAAFGSSVAEKTVETGVDKLVVALDLPMKLVESIHIQRPLSKPLVGSYHRDRKTVLRKENYQ